MRIRFVRDSVCATLNPVLAVLLNTKKSIERITSNLFNARQAYNIAKIHNLATDQANANARMVSLRQELDTARLQYDSSPNGLKNLELQVSVAEKEDDMVSYPVYDSYSHTTLGKEVIPVDHNSKFISAHLMKSDQKKIELAAAKNHREWQLAEHKAFESLSDDEAVSRADLSVQVLEQQLNDKSWQSTAIISVLKMQEENSANSGQDIDYSASHNAKMYRDLVRNALDEKYIQIQIDDLKSLSAAKSSAPVNVKIPKTVAKEAVRHLRPGMRIGNGTILSVQAGVKTPKGKKEVSYVDNKGIRHDELWNASTQIIVFPED